jgi:hypothetical protein
MTGSDRPFPLANPDELAIGIANNLTPDLRRITVCFSRQPTGPQRRQASPSEKFHH